MKSIICPAVVASVVLLGGCASDGQETATQDTQVDAAASNPFYAKSTLPYQYPPFDKVKDEHYRPAYDRGMADEMAEVEAIANNPAPATFDNTIVALERTGELLNRVDTVFGALTSAHTNDEMKKIDVEYAPKLQAHADAIALNAKLYTRVKALFDARATLGLDAESARLLERYHIRFVRAGAQLGEEQKTRLKAINAELATLGTQFSQNLQNDTNASAVVVDTREELDGFSDQQIAAAAEAAKARKLEGKYVISLILPTPQPALTNLKNRALRERIHTA